MKTNLWPIDIGQGTGERGPATLLKEQASLLAQLTKGLVEAEVRSGQDPHDQSFVDDFILVGTTINYSYTLFTVEYPIDFYPAKIFFGPLHINGEQVPDDESLAHYLSQIFAHEKTRQVINAIIARSQ